MSEEELKAIEDLKKTINYYDKKFKDNERITSVLVDNFDVNNLYILLNLVKKQQEEIEFKNDIIKHKDKVYETTKKSLKGQIAKKDKMIDLILNTFIEEVELDRYYKVYENMTVEDLKQYFENKVEGSK